MILKFRISRYGIETRDDLVIKSEQMKLHGDKRLSDFLSRSDASKAVRDLDELIFVWRCDFTRKPSCSTYEEAELKNFFFKFVFIFIFQTYPNFRIFWNFGKKICGKFWGFFEILENFLRSKSWFCIRFTSSDFVYDPVFEKEVRDYCRQKPSQIRQSLVVFGDAGTGKSEAVITLIQEELNCGVNKVQGSLTDIEEACRWRHIPLFVDDATPGDQRYFHF